MPHLSSGSPSICRGRIGSVLNRWATFSISDVRLVSWRHSGRCLESSMRSTRATGCVGSLGEISTGGLVTKEQLAACGIYILASLWAARVAIKRVGQQKIGADTIGRCLHAHTALRSVVGVAGAQTPTGGAGARFGLAQGLAFSLSAPVLATARATLALESQPSVAGAKLRTTVAAIADWPPPPPPLATSSPSVKYK